MGLSTLLIESGIAAATVFLLWRGHLVHRYKMAHMDMIRDAARASLRRSRVQPHPAKHPSREAYLADALGTLAETAYSLAEQWEIGHRLLPSDWEMTLKFWRPLDSFIADDADYMRIWRLAEEYREQ